MQQVLNEIEQNIASGYTVMVGFTNRAVKITPKTFNAYKQAGKAFFRVSEKGNLQMLEGKSYVNLSCGGNCLMCGIKFFKN